jgi:hypothetical protein
MLAKLDKRDVEMIMGSGVQLRGEIHIELLDDHCRFCTFPTTSNRTNRSITLVRVDMEICTIAIDMQAPEINVTESDITTTVERKKRAKDTDNT